MIEEVEIVNLELKGYEQYDDRVRSLINQLRDKMSQLVFILCEKDTGRFKASKKTFTALYNILIASTKEKAQASFPRPFNTLPILELVGDLYDLSKIVEARIPMSRIQHRFSDRCMRMIEGNFNQKVLIFNNFQKENSKDKEALTEIFALEAKLHQERQACNKELDYCLKYRA